MSGPGTRRSRPRPLAVGGSLLVTLFVALAALPAASRAGAETPAATRCRAALAKGSLRYLERVLAARSDCLDHAIDGAPQPPADCTSDHGDAPLGLHLGRATSRFEQAASACAGVDLGSLGFPGPCADQGEPPFDLDDLRHCILDGNDAIVAALLGTYYPPNDELPSGAAAGCLKQAARDAAGSFLHNLRARGACALSRERDRLESAVQCRNEIQPWGPGTGDDQTDRDIARTYQRLLGRIASNCAGVDVDPMGYEPGCSDATGGTFTTDDLEQCLFQRNGAKALEAMALVFPVSPSCGDGVPDAAEDCDDGTQNSNSVPNACRTDCRDAACGDGVVDAGEDCDDDNRSDGDGCRSDCAVCGNGLRSGNEECDGSDAGACAPGEGCTSACTCAPACPGTAEIPLQSGVGAPCTTNADCPIGSCDDDLGRCRTASRLDLGWTGLGHASDVNGGFRNRLLLDCASPGPTCGTCDVTGVDPTGGSCRCSNDTRVACDEPFEPDDDDCGGSTCQCYLGAPLPLSVGGTPFCLLDRLARPVQGTVNVDLGSAHLATRLATQVFLGIGTRDPCPTCGGTCTNPVVTACDRNVDCAQGDFCDGDPAPNDSQKQGTCLRLCDGQDDCGEGRDCQMDPEPGDGVRGGRCRNGRNHTTTCDPMAANTTFPAFPAGSARTNGASYSLDCLPDIGKNVTGAGLLIQLEQTTGTASMTAQLSCGGQIPNELCQCLACSTNPSVGCNSDADCVEALGCAKFSQLNPGCTTNSDCVGVSVGRCGLGSVCSNAPSIACTTNADCTSVDAGPCVPGTCSTKGGASAESPAPNQCENLDCATQPDGTGKCATGPDETYCDGVVRADGTGILLCLDDEGCTPGMTGVDAGKCTLVERRRCFPDPIVAVGLPHPEAPVTAAVFCVAATSGAGKNAVFGLPGPGRLLGQTTLRTFCQGDPDRPYEPGVGGCLD